MKRIADRTRWPGQSWIAAAVLALGLAFSLNTGCATLSGVARTRDADGATPAAAEAQASATRPAGRTAAA